MTLGGCGIRGGAQDAFREPRGPYDDGETDA